MKGTETRRRSLEGWKSSEKTSSWRVTTARRCSGEPAEETEFVKFDLWSLVDAFSNIYESRKKSEIEEISLTPQTYTVEERKSQMIEIMRSRKEVIFEDLFGEDINRMELVVTFLSILELLKDGILDVFQPTFEEPIKIILREKNGR